MLTTVSSKGQIVLPAAIRRQDDITAGQQFEVERLERGEYRLRRKTRRRNQGLVQLLLACPAKDWFKPTYRAETIRDLNAPVLRMTYLVDANVLSEPTKPRYAKPAVTSKKRVKR